MALYPYLWLPQTQQHGPELCCSTSEGVSSSWLIYLWFHSSAQAHLPCPKLYVILLVYAEHWLVAKLPSSL